MVVALFIDRLALPVNKPEVRVNLLKILTAPSTVAPFVLLRIRLFKLPRAGI